MDWKQTVSKYWWVGAAVLLLLFLFRPKQGRSTVATVAAIEGQKPTSDGILDQTMQRLSLEEAQRYSRLQAAQEKLAMQGMEQQAKLLQAQSGYQLSIFQGQQALQDRLTSLAKKAPLACPDGKAKVNPATGELYCRIPKGGGITIGNLFKKAVDLAPQIIGMSAGIPVGTPPIVPWQQNQGGY